MAWNPLVEAPGMATTSFGVERQCEALEQMQVLRDSRGTNFIIGRSRMGFKIALVFELMVHAVFSLAGPFRRDLVTRDQPDLPCHIVLNFATHHNGRMKASSSHERDERRVRESASNSFADSSNRATVTRPKPYGIRRCGDEDISLASVPHVQDSRAGYRETGSATGGRYMIRPFYDSRAEGSYGLILMELLSPWLERDLIHEMRS